MHLDTVFSFCDRDAVTVFREVVDQIACYSVYPGGESVGVDIRKDEKPLLEVVQKALGLKKSPGRRDWRRRLRCTARAVG